MKLLAYRIARRRYAAAIWTGAGAKERGGRWNSKGVAVVYASENRSLAAMEQLVHLLPPRVLRGFVISSIEFDEAQVERVNLKSLPRRWDHKVAPVALRRIGDEFVARGRTVAFAVPSAVIRGEWNYLFNPAHRDFAGLRRSAPVQFVYDKRLS